MAAKLWFRISILIAMAFFGPGNLFSQSDSILIKSWNGCNFAISSGNGLGKSGTNAVEFPQGSGKYPLRRLQFWVSGTNNSNDTFAVFADLFGNKSYWWPGPMGKGMQKHVAASAWATHLQVTSSQVKSHQLNYGNKGYIVPENIALWPGTYVRSGFDSILAPFADINQNGIYDPAFGDYPYLPASEHVFNMASDSSFGGHTVQTGLDLSSLWFAPVSRDSAGSTAMVRLTLCNRGSATLSDVRLSLCGDFSIGNSIDDQLATHVGYNAIYAYNQPGGDAIYGNNWPAVALGFLNTKAGSSIYFNNSTSTVQGAPDNDVHVYRYASGLWRSGGKMGSSGSGLDASSSVSKFVYPGTTDPSLPSGRNWTNAEASAGKVNAMISTTGFQLPAHGCKIVDAFVTVVEGAPDSTAMNNALSGLLQYYNNREFTLGRKQVSAYQSLRFPNPVIQGATVTIPTAKNGGEVRDLQGKLVLQFSGPEFHATITPGMYLLLVKGYQPGKLLVQ